MLMERDTLWLAEGNNWFIRNRQMLGNAAMLEYDWPLRLIRLYGLDPRTIVEVGCSNGWRLAALSENGRRICIGVDASADAITDGETRYPKLDLRHALATCLPLPASTADLVIVSYLYHWIPREDLLTVISECERILRPGGFLILADFAPDQLTVTPYKHRVGVSTWKLPDGYAGLFLATGLYREVARVTYNHDDHDNRADTPSERRGCCALLVKESQYRG